MMDENLNKNLNRDAPIHNLDEFLDFTIQKAVRITQAKAGSLLLLDEKMERLYFKVVTGEKKEEVKKFEIKVGQGIAGKVAQTGVPMLIEDVSKDSRWDSDISRTVDFQTRSIVCAPMKVGHQTIGVVEIIDKVDGHPFEEDDLKVLLEFGELAAHARAPW